jgi:CheY-like chemotaxis protein
LERLQANAYDGVLMDLMMPMKDGFAVLARKGSTRNADAPAYVLTTLGEEKRALALELGARKVFLKSEDTAAARDGVDPPGHRGCEHGRRPAQKLRLGRRLAAKPARTPEPR